jgi:hypothetical protein
MIGEIEIHRQTDHRAAEHFFEKAKHTMNEQEEAL